MNLRLCPSVVINLIPKNTIIHSDKNVLYPCWHVMSLFVPVMIVQDHDGRHYGACHHEHDAVEISSWRFNILIFIYKLHKVFGDHKALHWPSNTMDIKANAKDGPNLGILIWRKYVYLNRNCFQIKNSLHQLLLLVWYS